MRGGVTGVVGSVLRLPEENAENEKPGAAQVNNLAPSQLSFISQPAPAVQ
jgi:hypothetical protein